ncbi:MAG: carboxypeptidase-like regulatory domain-containing protein, partial [Duncaniella sp.]|nr:carboxypeptidase-like regulatory domain-containing protein [Duncaniella sp.]
MQTFYEDVMREIDVYANDIPMLQTRFVSPLSRIAPDFYKFYLSDTVAIDSVECVELTFVPRNAATMGFTGRFYVPVGDSTMFIKRIVMRVPHDINLNFINSMLITQDYEQLPDGTRIKTKDDMIMEAELLSGLPGMYARRNTVYTAHNFDPAPDPTIFDRGQAQVYASGAYGRDSVFWAENRTTTIAKGENSIEKMMQRFRAVPIYYWSEKIIKTFASGYITTGNPSKFDFGPLTSSFSVNSLEGLRLRVGGMTTAALSKRWFARGYVARGFKDHRWKYRGEVEYSFVDKRQHSREFPVHSIRATQLYDMNMLGQHFTSNNQDNMFMSFKWQKDIQMTYHRLTKLEYILEMENNFSINLRMQSERQEATRYMTFTNGYGRSFGHYTMNTATLELRYAPGEKFYQMKTGRVPINFDAPIFTLSHTWALKGVLGNPFALGSTEASFSKRFWFSAFGYMDVFLKGGHVWT